MLPSPLPTLENELVTLRPLVAEDREPLFKIASDKLLWEQHSAYDRYQRPVFDALFDEGVASRGAFTLLGRRGGRVIGSTRLQWFPPHTMEIGWTFLDRTLWGTGYNAAMKSLLIDYLHKQELDVLFIVYTGNIRSQKAVLKLGARQLTDPGHPLYPASPEKLAFLLPAPHPRTRPSTTAG